MAQETETPSGTFETVSTPQLARINRIGKLVRANRAQFEQVMAPDPDNLKDKDGALYWGSRRHVVETMLWRLEAVLRNMLGPDPGKPAVTEVKKP